MSGFDDAVVSRRRWIGGVSAPLVAAAVGQALLPRNAAAAQDDSQLNGARVYNIRDFGAKGDGVSLDTIAVQTAIDACARDGGGTVLVPAGRFVIGTVELKSYVTIHICAGGTLVGSGDGKQYHAIDAIPLSGDSTLNDGNVGLIFAVEAVNIAIEGMGTIDGQGAQFHSAVRGTPPPAGIGGARRPYSILFHRCENIVLRDFKLVDSAFHAIRIIQSTYFRADGLHVHSRVNSNNDGFHFISVQHVNISNCNIECQDDACALFGSCQFVNITNCSFSTRWSVFRFGGGNVRNIVVTNCVIYECYGCPIKIRCGNGSVFENMSFSNLQMHDVTGPISIGVGPSARRRGATQPATFATDDNDSIGNRRPVLRNISFNNIRATVPSSPQQLRGQPFITVYRGGEIRSTIVLNGVGDGFLQDISFTDVHITYGGGGTAAEAARRDVPQQAGEYFELDTLPAYGLYARNVHGLTLRDVRFEVLEPDLRPAVVFDHVEDAAINGLSIAGNVEAESALRFIDTKFALLSGSRMLTPAAVFLRVEGGNSEGIKVEGGDLSRAKEPLVFADGATKDAVKFRE